MIFADFTPSSDTPAVVGAFVTVILGFLGIAKIMLTQASKDRTADRQEREKLAAAITLMADNSGKVAKATERGANEAKQRNGHLAELIIQTGENTQAIANTAVSAIIEGVSTQHIDKQTVDKQIIKKGK